MTAITLDSVGNGYCVLISNRNESSTVQQYSPPSICKPSRRNNPFPRSPTHHESAPRSYFSPMSVTVRRTGGYKHIHTQGEASATVVADASPDRSRCRILGFSYNHRFISIETSKRGAWRGGVHSDNPPRCIHAVGSPLRQHMLRRCTPV